MTSSNVEVKIVADRDAESPRTWDNLGVMVCAHRRYDLGDKSGLQQAVDFVESIYSERELERMGFDRSHVPSVHAAIESCGKAVLLPLFLYDHSGITMKTTPFSCRWDSGQVGFIFVSYETLRSEYGYARITPKRVQKAKEHLRGEVETYDQFLTGDVWGFEVVEDGSEDSCWGFYGGDPMTNGMSSHFSSAVIAEVAAGNFQRIY